LLELLQHHLPGHLGLTTALTGRMGHLRHTKAHGIAQWASHPVEDGGPQQELLHPHRLLFQHLLNEVIQDKAVAPRERADRVGDIPAPLHRDRRQLQASDPPLGAGFEYRDLVRREVQPHHLVQELGRLGRRKAQLFGAQLVQLAAGAPSGQGERRIVSRRDGKVEPRGEVFEEKGDRVMDGLRLDDVIVIQDQKGGGRARGQVVDQGDQDRLRRGRLGRVERGRGALSDGLLVHWVAVLAEGLQGGDHIVPKAVQVAVALVEREPGNGHWRRRVACQVLLAKRVPTCAQRIGPLAHQRRLAKPRWGGHEREAAVQALGQPLDQMGSRHALCCAPERRNHQFRAQQRDLVRVDGKVHIRLASPSGSTRDTANPVYTSRRVAAQVPWLGCILCW